MSDCVGDDFTPATERLDVNDEGGDTWFGIAVGMLVCLSLAIVYFAVWGVRNYRNSGTVCPAYAPGTMRLVHNQTCSAPCRAVPTFLI